jgi:hypothetical protein
MHGPDRHLSEGGRTWITAPPSETLDLAERTLRAAGLEVERDEGAVTFAYDETAHVLALDDDGETLILWLLAAPMRDLEHVRFGEGVEFLDQATDDLLLAPLPVATADGTTLALCTTVPRSAMPQLMHRITAFNNAADAFLEAAYEGPALPMSFMTALATLHTARSARRAEPSEEHRIRMARAIDEKVDVIRRTFPPYVDAIGGSLTESVVERALFDGVDGLEEHWGVRLLIDQCFSSPFAPYDIALTDSRIDQAVAATGRAIFGPAEEVEHVIRSANLERTIHSGIRNLSPGRLGVTAAGVALLLFASQGAALAAMAGGAQLSGAAAAAHGLAVLGGGTAHFGMAGGAVVLKAAGAAGARAVATGLTPLLAVGGTAGLAHELAHFQTTAIWTLEPEAWANAKADLAAQQAELRAELERQTWISDPASGQLKEQREAISAVDRAIASVERDGYDFRDELALGVERGLKGAHRKVRRAKDWVKDL